MKADFLLNIADILEKTAEYIDELEAGKTLKNREEQKKEAADLASKVKMITGEQLSSDVAEKLAAADPAVKDLFSKISCSDNAPDSWGNPENSSTIKVAGSNLRGMGSAENDLLAWLSD